MMILDLGVCPDRVLDDPGAFRRLLWKLAFLEEFHKFGLKCILVLSMSVWNSESGNSSVW